MSQPTVIITAAGDSKRFFPLNLSTHKSSIVLLGKSLLQRTLENLKAHHFSKVVIILSPKDADNKGLSSHIHSLNLSLDISFVTQSVAKGTGNALLGARELVTGEFAVLHPYNYLAGELLTKMIKQKQSNKAQGIVIGSTSKNTQLEGILRLENNRVLEVVEKPPLGTEPSKVAIRGTYLFDHSFFDVLAATPEFEYSFEAAITSYASNFQVDMMFEEKNAPSLKYPWHLFEHQKFLLSNEKSATHSQAKVASTAIIDDSLGPVVIEEGAEISHFAKILGPAYIGKNAYVGDYSFVRQSSMESESSIGAKSELVRSIMLPGSKFHFGYIADSILGNQVKIGAGIITANKRLDRENVRTVVSGKKIDTGLKTLGTIIGDQANLGIAVKTMPGTLIGSRTIIYPDTLVKKNLEHSQILKAEVA